MKVEDSLAQSPGTADTTMPTLTTTDLRQASRRSLMITLALIASFMVVEVVGGVILGSLSLLADAVHMLTDAATIGLALVALHFSDLPASWERT